MAITSALKSKPPVSVEERTWRANIETPKGGEYSIQVYRQFSQLDEDGKVVSTELNTSAIHRVAKDIIAETVTLQDGTVVPAALVLAALPLFFDKWAEEDQKAKEEAKKETP